MLSGESRFTGARRVQNLLTGSSIDIFAAPWGHDTQGTGTHSRTLNYATAPDGTTTAVRYQWSNGGTAANWTRFYQSIGTARSSGISSVWLKSNTGSSQTIYLFDPGPSTAVLCTVTTTWQRFVSNTRTSGLSQYFGYVAAGVVGNCTTDGDILVWGSMGEEITGQSNQNPSEYVSVGVLSAPYHGAGVDGVKYFTTLNGNTVSSNVVTEATGVAIKPTNGSSATTTDASGPFGYLSEIQSINLLTFSNDVTNAAWVKTTMTTALTSTGPDGVPNSATRCTASAGNALALQTYVAAASSRTYSVWVKRITGTGNFQLTQDGTTFTTVTTTAGWTQVQLNASQLNAVLGFRIVTNGDAFDIWCNGFEAGAIATSPIPTTTVAVTRNADSLTYAISGNMLTATGAYYSEWTCPANATYPRIITSAAANEAAYFSSSTQLNLTDGTQRNLNTTTLPKTTPTKFATTWGGTSSFGSLAGVASADGGFDGTLIGAGTNFGIGAWDGGTGYELNGTVRNVKIYAATQTTTQLNALTA